MKEFEDELPITRQVTLDQYVNNPFIHERFSIDLNFSDESIERCEFIDGEMQTVEDMEIEKVGLGHFLSNCETAREEFKSLFDRELGEEKREVFFNLIKNEWIAPGRRFRSPIRQLEGTIKAADCSIHTVDEYVNKGVHPDLTPNDILKILRITRKSIDVLLQEWLVDCDLEFDSNEIYFFRGICLDEPPNEGMLFQDRRYIESYTLSLSLAEKFADSKDKDKKPVRAIVSIQDQDVFNRILFFTPLIEDVEPDQIEFGFIPSNRELIVDNVCVRGNHADVLLRNPVRQ